MSTPKLPKHLKGVPKSHIWRGDQATQAGEFKVSNGSTLLIVRNPKGFLFKGISPWGTLGCAFSNEACGIIASVLSTHLPMSEVRLMRLPKIIKKRTTKGKK